MGIMSSAFRLCAWKVNRAGPGSRWKRDGRESAGDRDLRLPLSRRFFSRGVLAYEFRRLLTWKLNRAGVPAPFRKRVGAKALGIVLSGFRWDSPRWPVLPGQ